MRSIWMISSPALIEAGTIGAELRGVETPD
jgi:hypothetical protein